MKRERSGSSGEPSTRAVRAVGLLAWAIGFAAIVSLVVPPARALAAFDVPVPPARDAALAMRGRLDSDADDEGWAVGLSGCELFGLRETRAWRAALESRGAPRVSFGASSFGGAVYRERVLSAAVRSKLPGGTAARLGVRALGISALGVREVWSSAIDAVVTVTLLDRLRLSCGWVNVGGSSIGDSPVAQSTSLSASVGAAGLIIVGSVSVEPSLPPSSSLGVELGLAPLLKLRAGAATEPSLFAAGLGIGVPTSGSRRYCCVLDVAWQWNPELGVSTFVTISMLRRPSREGRHAGVRDGADGR